MLPGKRHYRKVFGLYCSSLLSFAHCYHVVLMQRLKLAEIFSFDTGFDRIAGIKRREV